MDNVIVVTGHSRGIGAALVSEFISAGINVVGIDKCPNPNFHGTEIIVDLHEVVTDKLKKKDFEQNLLNAIGERKCIGLINNAAIQVLGGLDAISPEDCLKSLSVNAIAPLIIAQSLKPLLVDASGVILNISSIHATQTKLGFSAYAASKSALSAYSRSMSIEWGEGIKVLEIRPAAISTQMLEDGFTSNPAARKALDKLHPSGAIASPAELARQALTLVLHAESFLNGSVIAFDGGISNCLLDPDYL